MLRVFALLISLGVLRSGEIEVSDPEKDRQLCSMGYPRAAQNRSHRLSLAHTAVHQPASGVFLRRCGSSARCRQADGRSLYDVPEVRLHTCWRSVLVRRNFAHLRYSGWHPSILWRRSYGARAHLAARSAPQCSGLLAISRGLSINFVDDHEMLQHGMVIYDALYTWCRDERVGQ